MSKKFYIIIEAEDYVFDLPLDEFEKTIDKELEYASRDFREMIKEAYLRENSALGDSDEVEQSSEGTVGEDGGNEPSE